MAEEQKLSESENKTLVPEAKSVVSEQKVESKPVENTAPVKKAVVSSKPEVKNEAPVRSANFKHIVRIANVDIPGDKPIKIALRKIKGIGFNFAAVACNLTGIDKDKKTGELSDKEIKDLNETINSPKENGIPTWMFNRRKDYDTGEDQHLLIGTLDFAKDNTIKRLRKIKCYRGTRHSRGLPVRGQRTKANFRKSKGKVVGVAKKKAAAKSGK